MFINSRFDQVFFLKGKACGWEHYWNKGPHKAAARFLGIPSPVCFPECKERPCINLFKNLFPMIPGGYPLGITGQKQCQALWKQNDHRKRSFHFWKAHGILHRCKVLFRYTREIGGNVYKGEKKSVKMSGILLLLLLTTADMDEKIWELILKSKIWTATQWFNWLVRWYARTHKLPSCDLPLICGMQTEAHKLMMLATYANVALQ